LICGRSLAAVVVVYLFEKPLSFGLLSGLDVAFLLGDRVGIVRPGVFLLLVPVMDALGESSDFAGVKLWDGKKVIAPFFVERDLDGRLLAQGLSSSASISIALSSRSSPPPIISSAAAFSRICCCSTAECAVKPDEFFTAWISAETR